LGFPLTRSTWDLVGALANGQSNPSNTVWYNAGSISIPIGSWAVTVTCKGYFYIGGGGAGEYSGDIEFTLSSANNSESDATASGKFGGQVYEAAGYTWNCEGVVSIVSNKDLTAKVTWYINYRTSSGVTQITMRSGSNILLRCSYV
jgi:hypothetical protein